MKPASLAAALILALAGCAELGLPGANPFAASALTTPIAPAEVEWSRRSGANTVSGLAVRKVGDTSHTCAGQSANLVPDSAYARARMTAIFGNATRGTRAASLGPVKFERDDPRPMISPITHSIPGRPFK